MVASAPARRHAGVEFLSSPHSVPHPLMIQDWRCLSFLHWPYPPEEVARLLPPGVALDTVDGAAWVSLVPFRLRVRPPHGPAIPWACVFPETNVRTYVRGPDGRHGVWFLSLDVPRRVAIHLARMTYHLPYQLARVRVHQQGPTCRYTSRRPDGGGSAATVTRLERIAAWEVSPLDAFLTARWRLYVPLRGGIGTARVEHAPYRLWRASASDVDAGLLAAAGLALPASRPLVHGCDDVTARMSRLRRCMPAERYSDE